MRSRTASIRNGKGTVPQYPEPKHALQRTASVAELGFVRRLDHRMITTFDLLQIGVPFFLALVGGALGSEIGGSVGLVVGAVAGCVPGVFLGRIPWLLAIRSTRRKLSGRSTGQLLTELREHRTFTPNFLLHELASRGHDISAELPVMFDLLASEHFHCRTRGWAAVLSAFPGVARQMQSYSPAHSIDRCRSEVERIRQLFIAQSPSSNATGA